MKDDIGDIYSAICELEFAIRKIEDTIRGSNDPNYEYCKYARITLKSAQGAFSRLEREKQ